MEPANYLSSPYPWHLFLHYIPTNIPGFQDIHTQLHNEEPIDRSKTTFCNYESLDKLYFTCHFPVKSRLEYVNCHP
jgi:hypothetical protein